MKRPRSSGFTLVEVLGVMACLSIILGMCVALVQGLLKVERAAQTQLVEGATFARLAGEFKRHAHEAAGLRGVPAEGRSAAELEFKLPDGTLASYRAADRAVELTIRNANSVVRHERFSLSHYGVPHFEARPWEQRVLVSVIFPRPSLTARTEASPPLRIDAVLARDHETAAEEGKP